MPIKRNCLQCRKEFGVSPSYIKRGKGKYCSQKCMGLAYRKRIKRNCLVCNKELEINPYQIKNGEGKYCSHKCHDLSRITKIKLNCLQCNKKFEVWPSVIKKGRKHCSNECRRKRVKKTCLHCDKEFKVIPSRIKKGEGKYCSIECNNLYKAARVIKNCFICKKKFKGYLSDEKHKRGKYCSRECFYIGNVGENASAWRGGISYDPYTLDFNKRLKEAVRKRDNYCCQVCNTFQDDFKIKLAIHHIDYNKKNSFPQNLISLCKKCHMITNYNRTHWKTFLQTLLKERQGYEYTSEQKIVFDFTNKDGVS